MQVLQELLAAVAEKAGVAQTLADCRQDPLVYPGVSLYPAGGAETTSLTDRQALAALQGLAARRPPCSPEVASQVRRLVMQLWDKPGDRHRATTHLNGMSNEAALQEALRYGLHPHLMAADRIADFIFGIASRPALAAPSPIDDHQAVRAHTRQSSE